MDCANCPLLRNLPPKRFETSPARTTDGPRLARMPRNPPWTRDELILALDLYFRHRPSSQEDPEVIALSDLLNALPIHSERPDAEHFRNPNGVYMKLGNFMSIDPAYEGAGLRRGNRLEQIVWDEFAGDRERLRAAAEAIRAAVAAPEKRWADAIVEEAEYDAPEGRVLYRVHRSRERNAALVRRRKQLALEKDGRLACEVCGFDFSERYGALGDGFIECHHTIPVSQLKPGDRTRLQDLALVCANCHRMLHRGGEKLTSDALRGRLQALTGAA